MCVGHGIIEEQKPLEDAPWLTANVRELHLNANYSRER